MRATKGCDMSLTERAKLAYAVAAADWTPSWGESQSVRNAHWHAMGQTSTMMGDLPAQLANGFIKEQMEIGTTQSIGRAIHVLQDMAAGGHDNYQRYTGRSDLQHFLMDFFPSNLERYMAILNTTATLPKCQCKQ
jgi:hypothetical protein